MIPVADYETESRREAASKTGAVRQSLKIAVVIPCYNVALQIEDVILHLPDYIDVIIAVNDCSKDETDKVLQGLTDREPRLDYIRHEVNKGVGGAMISGFQRALELDCDTAIKIDGDGQMDTGYIGKLLTPIIEKRADFTKGNRFRDFSALRAMPAFRRFGNLGLSFLIKAASGYWNIFDPTNGFIAINRSTLERLNFKKIHNRYFFESSLLIELYHTNAVICEVPMKARYGDEISHLSITRTLFEFPPKLFIAFVRRIILKYFLFEFNIASFYFLFGAPLFLFGVIYGVINFIRYGASHIPAPTGTVVIPTLLIILGFQLLLSAANYDVMNYPKQSNQTL